MARYVHPAAVAFNQTLASWDVSSVTDMAYMFNDAAAFNQPLNAWNVSSVTNMEDYVHQAPPPSTRISPTGTWCRALPS